MMKNMNEKDLKNMSQSELITLIMKLNKEPVPAPRTYKPVPAPRTYKPIVESVKPKQKMVYNLNNLLNDDPFPKFVVRDDFERKMIKLNNKGIDINEQSSLIDSKYQNLTSDQMVKDTRKIRNYPMIEVRLEDFRISEIKSSSDKNRAKMGFVELFETRLDKIPGKREIVSIVVDVEISQNMNGIDAVAQAFADIDHKRKKHGPFTVKKPINLSNQDVYKFAMYTLLKNGFSALSGEFISGIGYKIMSLTKKQIKKLKMGGLKLGESYLLSKQRPIKFMRIRLCMGPGQRSTRF